MRVYVNEKPDNPQEGDIWFSKNDVMYKYIDELWIILVSPSERGEVNESHDDYLDDLQKTSETHVVIPLLCLGILVSLTALMLLLMIL